MDEGLYEGVGGEDGGAGEGEGGGVRHFGCGGGGIMGVGMGM